jgi:hypothetical protein
MKKEVGLSDESRRLFVKGAKAILQERNDMMATGNAGNAPDLFELANLFCDAQLHVRQHKRANLHADLSKAADSISSRLYMHCAN